MRHYYLLKGFTTGTHFNLHINLHLISKKKKTSGEKKKEIKHISRIKLWSRPELERKLRNNDD